MSDPTALLEIRGLRTVFATRKGLRPAVDGIDLTIRRDQTLGLVGESGCGKSVTALSIMGLLPSPPGSIESGSILYRRAGEVIDLARQSPRGVVMRHIRGNEIAMIFQEPMSSLNPVYTVGAQITEAIRLHQRVDAREARDRALRILEEVGVSSPWQRLGDYPHQLSGGMRQRVMIAMALSCNPALLIADEPTTALDVTIQAQVLDLMRGLRREHRASILFITHDLGVIAAMADHVAVMYLGRVVESAPVGALFRRPLHPYTKGLLECTPSILRPRGRALRPIEGSVPSPGEVTQGCVFAPRCPSVMDICRQVAPRTIDVDPGHTAACWIHSEQR